MIDQQPGKIKQARKPAYYRNNMNRLNVKIHLLTFRLNTLILQYYKLSAPDFR